MREISAQLVEEFKNNRSNTPTKKNTPRRPATVNRELTLLSSAFSLAVKYDKAETNPCFKGGPIYTGYLRYRYLLPDEEPRLMAALTGPRAHLQMAFSAGADFSLVGTMRVRWSQTKAVNRFGSALQIIGYVDEAKV